MAIPLSNLITIADPSSYKLHAARWNGRHQPLDHFVEGHAKWMDWNRWRSGKNEFNRKFLFSLIDFYPEPNVWLFGGIFEVLGCGPELNNYSYEIREVEEYSELVGRLKIAMPKVSRGRAFRLENFYEKMEIHEVLPSAYSGEVFPGYEDLDITFSRLAAIFKNQKSDWKSALKNVKGVYLITDQSNGKRYVGSAYGDFGLWSRWACYVGTGHGWSDELTQLIKQEGYDYALENFKVTLLEYRPMKTSDAAIIARECFWKQALLTRTEYGYNKN